MLLPAELNRSLDYGLDLLLKAEGGFTNSKESYNKESSLSRGISLD